MKASGWIYLLSRELLGQKGRTVLVVLCVAASMAISTVAASGLLYLRASVRPQLRRLFPEDRLVVRPPNVDFSLLNLQLGKIDRGTVEAIEGIPGVSAVYPQIGARFPAVAEVSISRVGASYTSEVVMQGVPPELLAGELGPNVRFSWGEGENRPVPVVLSAYFLDLYNLGLAESAGLPRLSRKAAIGREFDLILGASFLDLPGQGDTRDVRAQIVGLTSNPQLVGITVPMDVLQDWNRHYRPSTTEDYSLLHVDISDPEQVQGVREQIEELGVIVDVPSDSFERIEQGITVAEGTLLAVLLIIVALAGVAIVSTVTMAARERRSVWGLHRATGMTPISLLVLVTGEAVAVGGVGILLGGVAALLALSGLSNVFGQRLEELSVLPGNPFVVSIPALAFCALVSIGLVLVPLGLALMNGVRKEPIELFRQRSL